MRPVLTLLGAWILFVAIAASVLAADPSGPTVTLHDAETGAIVEPGGFACGISPAGTGFQLGESVTWHINLEDGRPLATFVSIADAAGAWNGPAWYPVVAGLLSISSSAGSLAFVNVCTKAPTPVAPAVSPVAPSGTPRPVATLPPTDTEG